MTLKSEPTTSAAAPTVGPTPLSRLTKNLVPLAVGVILVVAVAVLVPNFFQLSNILNVGRQAAIVGVIAIGVTFVILTAGIDLSVGAILAVSGVTMALLINSGTPAPLAILAALCAGLVIGVINGLGAAFLQIQPFIMTLATMVAVQGLSLRLTSGGPIQFSNDDAIFMVMGKSQILGLPSPFVIFVLVSILGILALRYLTFGRSLYAIGGSFEAARLSGVPTRRTLVIAYGISGLCAALAGVMTASRLGTGDPVAGSLSNLDAITAVVIGGTSLLGGRGGAVGTVFGALLLAVLSNIMNLVGISPFDQQIVKGVVIIAAVLITGDNIRQLLKRRSTY